MPRTWIILSETGDHESCGRVVEPTDAEILEYTVALKNLGVCCWLAVLEGRYHGKRVVKVTMVRELVGVGGDFDKAVVKFEAIRRKRDT